MKISRAVVILALISSAAAFFGCVSANDNANITAAAGSSNSPLENANLAKTNAEELGLLVNLPYEPTDEDVVWKLDAAGKKLTAVLRFSSEDAKKVVAGAAGREAPQNTTISSETWFPPELIAQSEMSGDDSLKGLSYTANSFFQAPYASGRIVRVEGTDYFVLELSAK